MTTRSGKTSSCMTLTSVKFCFQHRDFGGANKTTFFRNHRLLEICENEAVTATVIGFCQKNNFCSLKYVWMEGGRNWLNFKESLKAAHLKGCRTKSNDVCQNR